MARGDAEMRGQAAELVAQLRITAEIVGDGLLDHDRAETAPGRRGDRRAAAFAPVDQQAAVLVESASLRGPCRCRKARHI